MKKVVICILIMALSALLVACNTERTQLDMAEEKLSYEETSLLVGGTDEYRVEVLSVSGEIAPRLDGKVGECSKRTVVKFIPYGLENVDSSYNVRLVSGDDAIEVTLEKDVLGLSFSATLMEDVMAFIPKEVMIVAKKDSDNVSKAELNNALSKTELTRSDIINKAIEYLGEDISTYFDEKSLCGEVVVKLIHNEKVLDSPYYYYVSFVKNKDEYATCLIDPISGEVVNKKVK